MFCKEQWYNDIIDSPSYNSFYNLLGLKLVLLGKHHYHLFYELITIITSMNYEKFMKWVVYTDLINKNPSLQETKKYIWKIQGLESPVWINPQTISYNLFWTNSAQPSST